MELPSKFLQNAVEQFSTLPGVGQKSALRLVLHLLRKNNDELNDFVASLDQLKNNVRFCKKCGNITDDELCGICLNPKRNHNCICVVEDLRDIMAIENTGTYNGAYHVLGGHISPMEGVGPGDLNIDKLIERVQKECDEVILALSTTMEGDTTNFYLYKKLKDFDVKITTIARGVAIGDALEYTDEVTLGRSIANRTSFESSLNRM